MDRIDVTQWPLVRRGTKFDDHPVGRTFEHHWGRTVHVSDNLSFTTSMLAFNPAYFNVECARDLGHPQELVNPMLVFAVVFGLSVEDLSETGGPFLGAEEIQFGEPVYPGDTLYAASTVVAARPSRSRPDSGVVTWLTVGRNQAGTEVIRFNRTNLVAGPSGSDQIHPVQGFLDDFSAGDRMRHARTKTITDVDLGYFTPLVMNSAQGHFSEALMAKTEFGKRINFGGLSLSLVVGLATQDTTGQAVRELGMGAVRFPHPVGVGDTLGAVTEVLAVNELDDNTGEVHFRHVGFNQDHIIVCEAERRVLVNRRERA